MSPPSRGSSLLEVLVALFLMLLGALAAAPMFLSATKANAVGADFGEVGAHGVARMEQLRAVDFGALTAGGQLNVNTTGYFDDSDPDYLVRWRVTDNTTPPRTKTIDVRVLATRQVQGQAKEVVLTCLRGR